MLKSNDQLVTRPIENAPARTLALVTRKSTPLQSEFDVLVQILQKIIAVELH